MQGKQSYKNTIIYFAFYTTYSAANRYIASCLIDPTLKYYHWDIGRVRAKFLLRNPCFIISDENDMKGRVMNKSALS